MKPLLACIAIVSMLILASPASAEPDLGTDIVAAGPPKAKLLHGAGTLPKGDWAFSLDLGFANPAPALYDIRFDWGISDRFQLGVIGSSIIISNVIAIPVGVNAFTSRDGAHLLGFRLTPGYTHINYFGLAKFQTFTIDPTLAYEYRWGETRNGGFFVEAGSAHIYSKVTDDFLNGFFGITGTTTTQWIHGIRGNVGFQQLIGDRFSVSLKGGALTNFSNWNVLPTFALGLTWVY
jgi:hypothetical protein